MEAKENLSDAETRSKSSEVQLGNLQLQIVDALKDTQKRSIASPSKKIFSAKNSLENEVDALKDTVATSTKSFVKKKWKAKHKWLYKTKSFGQKFRSSESSSKIHP